MLIQEFNLVNSDLDAQFCKTFTHNKNTANIDLEWFDENGVKITTPDVFQVLGTGSFTICTGGPITGTNIIRMIYDTTTQVTGTRLFADLPNNPNFATMTKSELDAYNMAYGNEVSSFNEPLGDFIEKCKGAVSGGALINTNNLSDVSDKSTARINLDVFNKTEVNSKFIPDEFPYTSIDIGTWDLKILNRTFIGALPGIVNTAYGYINSSFILTPEVSTQYPNEWVKIIGSTDLTTSPKETHTFIGMTSTGKQALCRVIGKTVYNESTKTFDATSAADRGDIEVFLIGQYEEAYYFNVNYQIGDYNS